MSATTNTPIDKIASESIGLAFVVFPQAISLMPEIFRPLFSILFFSGLLFAGLTSSVSMIDAFSSPVIDKTGASRKKVITITTIIGFLASTLWATGAGLYLLDIIDHFINAYGTTVIGLLEAVLISWFIGASEIRSHINRISYFSIGRWWDYAVRTVTPLVLIFMLVENIRNELAAPYGNYPSAANFLFGWLLIVIIIAASIMLMQLYR